MPLMVINIALDSDDFFFNAILWLTHTCVETYEIVVWTWKNITLADDSGPTWITQRNIVMGSWKYILILKLTLP